MVQCSIKRGQGQFYHYIVSCSCFCGLGVRLPGYRYRCPGCNSRCSSGSGIWSTQPLEDTSELRPWNRD
jgi:hypothetical protein